MAARIDDALLQIADGLWILDGPPVRWFTLPFPTRMTLIRLSDGSLFIHSPIELTPAVRRIVEELGVPRYIVSPNKLHYLFWKRWQCAYKDALSFAPPGLAQKRPDLVFQGQLGEHPDAAWKRDVDQLIFRGSRLIEEVVFFHRASRTAVFGDLIENFDPRALTWFHRGVARIGGVLAPHGGTPTDFRLSFRGRHDEARRCLQRLREWNPSAVVMCHGLAVRENAGPFIDAAFAWLR